MKFEYQAFERSGKPVRDTTDAADLAVATDYLRRQGLFVTEIKALAHSGEATVERLKFTARFSTGRRLKNIAMFLRQLHVLLSTGTPLVESLAGLERQAGDAQWRNVITSIKNKVEAGASLSAALSEHPAYFNAVCRGLVAAGESGGNLDAMLERLATLARKQAHTRNAVIGAMVYPLLLVFVAITVLIVLLTFVLPRFTQLFATLDTPLPPSTKFLMGLSVFTRAYWWSLPIILAVVVTAVRLWLNSAGGKQTMDLLLIRAPKFGALTRNFATAHLTRLIGTLLQGKVAMTEALELTKDATQNSYYVKLMVSASDAVTRGESFATAFADPRLISPSVYEAIRSGERAGQLGALLTTIADFLDEENEVTLRSLTSILEPLILIVLGVFVRIRRAQHVPSPVRPDGGDAMKRITHAIPFRSTPLTPIGLDVGSHSVKAAQLRHQGERWTVDRLAVSPRLSPSKPIDGAEVARIGSVLGRLGFRGHQLVLSLPPQLTLTAMLDLPPRAPGVPLDQIARTEFARMHSRQPDQLETSFWDLPEPSRGREGHPADVRGHFENRGRTTA